jgi:hypothetical protein
VVSAPAVQPRDRRWCVFPDVPESAILWKQYAHMTAPLKEQRRRDCARRHLAPYKGHVLKRQRFLGSPGTGKPDAKRQ